MKKYAKIFTFLIALIVIMSSCLIYAGYEKNKKEKNISRIAFGATLSSFLTAGMIIQKSSSDTIDRTDFAMMAYSVGDVEMQLDIAATEAKHNMAIEAQMITKPQAYNYIAKGGTSNDEDIISSTLWISREEAQKILCTKINPDNAENALYMELPIVEVRAENGKKIEASYYATNEGKVFIWPPYEYENEYYISGGIKVVDENENSITKSNSAQMFEDDFMLKVGNFKIPVGEYLK